MEIVIVAEGTYATHVGRAGDTLPSRLITHRSEWSPAGDIAGGPPWADVEHGVCLTSSLPTVGG